MTAVRHAARLFRHSLRGKLIAIVVGGVVVPLGLAAAWTAHQFRNAGEELLRSQLDASLAGIEGVIERNWQRRQGDLLLLGDNEVVRESLARPNSELTGADVRFLEDAFRIVQPTVDEVVFADVSGRARWRVAPDPGLQPRLERLAPGTVVTPSRLGSLAVDIPIRNEAQAQVGTMTAVVRMSALTQTPAVLGTAGASVDIEDGRGIPLVHWGAPASWRAATSASYTRVERALRMPPLRLVARAPLDPFIEPFARDARQGILLYGGILAVAFAIAAWRVLRATVALRRLAEGAEEVARGNLDYQVEIGSDDEIGRVAAAFNAMTRDLRRSVREASQRNALAAVGEFAAELAHEVRNPLTAIRLDLQRLQERLPTEVRTRDLLARALSTVERLNRTVTGALRVARSGTITPVPLQLAAALEPALQAAVPALAAREIALHRDTGDASFAWVRGDADALTQLFTNILINAAEAVDRNGRVDVSAAQQNGSVTVTIADSGPGMPAEILSQLEEPFHTTTKRGGTGLGLTIARRIASAHGGRIEFASHPGHGTTVKVTLPRQAPAEVPGPQA